MKILSIDVGMKNLAFCLLSSTSSISSGDSAFFSVDKWDVIDICSEEEKKTCLYIDDKGKACKSAAKFKKGNHHYCKKHSKKSKYLLPDPKWTLSKLKQKKLQELKDFCISKFIFCNDSITKKAQFAEIVKQYIENKYLEPIKETKANATTLVTLGKNIMKKFDSIFENETIDLVLIENQISPIANRMKTLQGMISQYFIMRDVEQIDFVSSGNKLKGFLDKKKTTYAERKKKGIEISLQYLEKYSLLNHWIEFFNSHKKKDDLADCYLQGLWYIKDKKLVETSEAK